MVNDAIFAAELKRKKKKKNVLFMRRLDPDSGFEVTFFNLDQNEVTRLSQITLLICQRVPEVILLIVC